MKTEKIFTPIIAVGLAVSLSVGSEKNQRDYIPDLNIISSEIEGLDIHKISNTNGSPDIFYKNNSPLESFKIIFDDTQEPSTALTFDTQNQQNAILNLGNEDFIGFQAPRGAWVNNFSIDLSTRNSSTSMELMFYGTGGYAAFSGVKSDGVTQKKTSFQIIDNQNDDSSYIRSYFQGGVFSDFLINAGGTYFFYFSQEESNPNNNNVTGDITITGIDNYATFDFSNVIYTGTFTNAISANTIINLNGSNTQFIGDINTTGGTTTVNFLTSGVSFQGNIIANGGNNEFVFEQDGQFNIQSNLSSDYTSQNIFSIDHNIVFNTSFTTTDIETNKANTPTHNNWGTFFNIANEASLQFSSQNSITTIGEGKTTITFQGSSGSFSGRLIADFSSKSGSNDITFAKNGTFGFDAVLEARSGYNRFLIDSNEIVISTSVTTSSQNDGGNSFIIGNGGSLSFFDGNNKTSLITSEGNTNIEFDNYGSLSGILQTRSSTKTITNICFKNTGSTSPYAIFDVYFYVYGHGQNIITINSSGTTIKSDNGLQFFTHYEGANIIQILGDNSSLSLSNLSGNQVQAINSVSDSENIIRFIGDSQTFNGNINSLGGQMSIVLGGQSDKTPNTEIVGKATINGNITANGGNNAFSFLYDGSTLSLGNGSQIIANSTSTNTFTINKNVVFLTDISFSGDNISGSGGNIININADKSLTLSANNTTKTISTIDGVTYLNLKGNNANLEGNISTSGGKTLINFQGNSQISGNLNISSSGETNITVADGKTASFIKPIEVNGNNASLFVNIGNDSTLRLNGGSGNLYNTSGVTTLSFNGSGIFSGNITTSSGSSTTFELGKTDGSLDSATITIAGVITNSNSNLATNTNAGENAFSVNATNTIFKYTSQADGLVFSHGQNAILFENKSNATLHWQGSDNTDKSISTIDGNTLIEFYQNGTLASGLDTSGGETTINLYGSKGVIEGEITTTGKGKSHIVFNESNSTLILKDNATLTSVSNLENHPKAYGSNNGISFYHDQRSGEDFKTLTIGTKDSSTDGISGDGLNFVVYATTNEVKTKSDNSIYSDKIIIHSSSNAGSSITILV